MLNYVPLDSTRIVSLQAQNHACNRMQHAHRFHYATNFLVSRDHDEFFHQHRWLWHRRHINIFQIVRIQNDVPGELHPFFLF